MALKDIKSVLVKAKDPKSPKEAKDDKDKDTVKKDVPFFLRKKK